VDDTAKFGATLSPNNILSQILTSIHQTIQLQLQFNLMSSVQQKAYYSYYLSLN
jgi:hypothetical protein